MVDLIRFLHVLPNKTNVRVKIAGCNITFATQLTSKNRDEFIHDIFLQGKAYPEIYCVTPLYHAQELYIECM